MTCSICNKPIGVGFFRDCPDCGKVHVLCDPCIKGDVHVDRVKINEGQNEAD